MNYVSADELVAINQTVIELSGGTSGVRETGLLESISIKPRTTFAGEDLYPDLFLKAAVMYEAIVNYHVFIDGNKRTGFAAMARFLAINDYEIKVTDRQIVDYSIALATEKPDLADIAVWVKHHARRNK